MKESYQEIKKYLDEHEVTLVAISKMKSPDEISQIYNSGQRIFGENKVHELLEKSEVLPYDIIWHLVGHLQTNKVKSILPKVSLIHSVDSWKLLQEIEKDSKKLERTASILIQVRIAEEETKYGLTIEDARKLLADDRLYQFESFRIRGLMGMATLTENKDQVRAEFRSLKVFYDEVKLKLITQPPISDITPSIALNAADFNILSMGMSNDYKIAVEEGSNMVRIGNAIFT